MKNEDCQCPMCEAFDDGYNEGFIQGYKEALKGQVEANLQIIENLEEDECCCDCGDCC